MKGLIIPEKADIAWREQLEPDVNGWQAADAAAVSLSHDRTEKAVGVTPEHMLEHRLVFPADTWKVCKVYRSGVAELGSQVCQVRAGDETDLQVRRVEDLLEGIDGAVERRV